MFRQLFSILGCLALPSTWRNPYPPHLPRPLIESLPPAEAPVKLPHDHIWADDPEWPLPEAQARWNKSL